MSDRDDAVDEHVLGRRIQVQRWQREPAEWARDVPFPQGIGGWAIEWFSINHKLGYYER